MMPLQWPCFFYTAAQPEAPLPVLGWFKQFCSGDTHYHRVTQHLNEQLLARPQPDPKVWGADPLRIRIGHLVCRRVQEAYSWPNDHFLPDDPFDIVFLMPWDDLDIVEMVLEFEEDLEITIDDAEAASWGGTTLSHVVDTLVAKCQAKSMKYYFSDFWRKLA